MINLKYLYKAAANAFASRFAVIGEWIKDYSIE
jgi:hypothetical protein